MKPLTDKLWLFSKETGLSRPAILEYREHCIFIHFIPYTFIDTGSSSVPVSNLTELQQSELATQSYPSEYHRFFKLSGLLAKFELGEPW